ncbi:MAG: hypothetical protein IMZ53_14930 [Thermoplasmata archaeon]|nr:hypothetical protein [Thermoplasmata archaeon]MBE3141868.1 hypothetical protein [Thermoplasmata archaeon]
MKLFIPLSHGQSIPTSVLRSIAAQDVDIVPCCKEGVFNSNHDSIDADERMCKLLGELHSRNLAVSFYNRHYADEKYVAMQDRDIVHLFEDNYKRCIYFLDQNGDYDAVALPWKDYTVTDHIRNAAFVIRGNVFGKMYFRIDERKHICLTMQEDIKICFLPSNKKLIQEEVRDG